MEEASCRSNSDNLTTTTTTSSSHTSSAAADHGRPVPHPAAPRHGFGFRPPQAKHSRGAAGSTRSPPVSTAAGGTLNGGGDGGLRLMNGVIDATKTVSSSSHASGPGVTAPANRRPVNDARPGKQQPRGGPCAQKGARRQPAVGRIAASSSASSNGGLATQHQASDHPVRHSCIHCFAISTQPGRPSRR